MVYLDSSIWPSLCPLPRWRLYLPKPSRMRPVDNSMVRMPDAWSTEMLTLLPAALLLLPAPFGWVDADECEDVAGAADAVVADVAVAFWFISCCGWRGGVVPLPLPLPLPDALRLTCVLSVVSTAGVTSGNVDVDAALPAADVVDETVERWKIWIQWVNALGLRLMRSKLNSQAEAGEAQKTEKLCKCARKTLRKSILLIHTTGIVD